MKNINIAPIKVLVPFGEFLNSFQIKTPHNAATKVAPCPNPYEIAGPALPAAMRLKEFPSPQINPPKIPTKCVEKLPLKYAEYPVCGPSKGFLIKIELKRKLLNNIPHEKINTAVYGVILPINGLSKLFKSMDAAIKR